MKINYAKKNTEVFSNQNEWLCMKYVLHFEIIIKYLEDIRKS